MSFMQAAYNSGNRMEARHVCKESSGQQSIGAMCKQFSWLGTQLGGGEGCTGLYGTIRTGGLHKVLAALANGANGSNIHLVDVGGGLCWPLLQACRQLDIASGLSIEDDGKKVEKAQVLVSRVAGGAYKDVITLVTGSIEDVQSLNAYTHAYSFWEGLTNSAKMAFGRLFVMSTSLRRVAVVQHAMRKQQEPEEMYMLGFGRVNLVWGPTRVLMSGSGRAFMAYVFEKVP
jgi:hypothetical protein